MCKVGWDLWLVRVSCECTDTREKLHGWTKASSSIPSALMVSNQIPGTPPPDLLLRCVAGSPGCAGLSTYLGTVGWTPGGGPLAKLNWLCKGLSREVRGGRFLPRGLDSGT